MTNPRSAIHRPTCVRDVKRNLSRMCSMCAATVRSPTRWRRRSGSGVGDQQVAQTLELVCAETMPEQVGFDAAELAVQVLERFEHAFGRCLEAMRPAIPVGANLGDPDAAFGQILGAETLGAQGVVLADRLTGHPGGLQE